MGFTAGFVLGGIVAGIFGACYGAAVMDHHWRKYLRKRLG